MNYSKLSTFNFQLSTFNFFAAALFAAMTSATTAAQAQTARQVLDATAARMTQQGPVQADFKVTQFSGTTPQSEVSGTMIVDGSKYIMTTPELQTWYNGTLQWSMQTGSDEVNLLQPTPEENAVANPAAIVGIYRQGYNATMTDGTLRGRATHVVHLQATKSDAEFSEIYIDTERSTYTPLCIRAKHNGDWTRLSIYDFRKASKTKAADFEFPKKKYPDVEIIDLR